MTSDYNRKFDRSNNDLRGPNRHDATATAWIDLLVLKKDGAADVLGERERAFYDAMHYAREALVEAGEQEDGEGGYRTIIEGIIDAIEARIPLRTRDEIEDLFLEIQAEHIDVARAACDELNGTEDEDGEWVESDDDDVWENVCLCAYPSGFSDLEQRIINAYYNK